jgi:biotin synthase
MDIRVSTGSAIQLGLQRGNMLAAPTTLYTMLGDACAGGCLFCTQSRASLSDPKFLSRVSWPLYDLEDVVARLKSARDVGRLCIQTTKYPGLVPDLLTVVEAFRAASDLPISICMNPVSKATLLQLKDAGADRVGVGLDCASEATFNAMKPGFSWAQYQQFVADTLDVFGTGSVHLIVGLGDSDEAMVRSIQRFHDRGCTVALFAFTPVRGTVLEIPPPPAGRYRALQLARHLIVHDLVTLADLRFEGEKLVQIDVAPGVLQAALDSGTVFRTSGCPSCNRPLYNERPGGVMYNFPQPLTVEEKEAARRELSTYLEMPGA